MTYKLICNVNTYKCCMMMDDVLYVFEGANEFYKAKTSDATSMSIISNYKLKAEVKKIL